MYIKNKFVNKLNMQGIKDHLGFANDSEIRKLLDPDGIFMRKFIIQFNREGFICRENK